MSTSRRVFLKSMIAGAGVALDGLPALASADGLLGNTDPFPSTIGEVQHSSESTAHFSGYTRGIGIYPGSPQEDFSPDLLIDNTTYRNLALHRPAYHSSSYDYNLTAQLITDGIKDTRLPERIATATNFRGMLPKHEREIFLDHNATTFVELHGPRPWVQIQLEGGESVPEIDRIEVLLIAPPGMTPEQLSLTASISEGGRVWKKIGSIDGSRPISLAGYPPDFAQPGQLFKPSIPFNAATKSRFYQVECSVSNPRKAAESQEWRICEVAFFRNGQRIKIGGPYSFTSAWMSAGLGEEWVYVDLGARCEFDRVSLYWIARAADGVLQVSDDTETWRDIQALTAGTESTDDIKLTQAVNGRYVRVLMKRPASPYGYILSEMEIYGRGGFVARPKPLPSARAAGRFDLSAGEWRLQRSSLVSDAGEALSRTGFKNEDWIVATVPGTALTSYLNVGAIPDPNFGKNQLYVSDSFFYSDFWYRTEFVAPSIPHGQLTWLNLDGINWKADIFLNGQKLGRIEGGFMRGRFDVTDKILPGQKNALSLRVEKNATPGSTKQKTFESPGKNGGALGADNPTYHASIGWDWIPTIRGRNTGIWGGVYLTQSSAVTLEDPFVQTTLPLPDTSHADISVEVDLLNHLSRPITGTLRGSFGEIKFEQRVTLEGSTRKKIKFDPSTHPGLRLPNPNLWWPAGYGDPNLYDVKLEFVTSGQTISDAKSFQAGIRQMAYSEEGGALRIWINGRRLVAKGGNWGFGESMLLYRAREYDAAVRYHREMNFTMIRNWVGQIGDEEFYDACDRNGIMVWQDFWLANPWDGPDPDNNEMFLGNAKDFVLRIRNHASIGLYCGRNEGFPPEPLEKGLRKLLSERHPGIHYIPSSADNVVSGHGPYMAMPLSFYFREGADTKLHSEMGMPNIPTIDSVRAMMPKEDLWPQGLVWGLHDFCLEGAQGGNTFRNIIDDGYGGTDNVEEWVTLAQFLNYEGYRAMFEGQSKYRMGLLLWMSHPCWPSFVWQTYDYYLEPTAAYFGCKKGCEPLHIQWNRLTESIEVVNYSGGNLQDLNAQVELLNLDGSKQWEKSTSLYSKEDSVTPCIPMEYPTGLSPVHFLRLTLKHGGEVVSANFYLRGLAEGDYRAIRQLPRAKIEAATRIEQQGDRWLLTTELHNASTYPALMVRLKAVRERSGDRILPVLYSDNYIALMPGETRSIRTEVLHADTRGEKPRVAVEGFNVESTQIG
jgi:Exo-beta-D-glucosaminidase Ig-fold domain/Glycosyl hydrolases family 2/F5/8 type C domain